MTHNEKQPEALTPEQIAAQIRATADPIDAANPGYAGLLGKGRANFARALTENNPAVGVTEATVLSMSGRTFFLPGDTILLSLTLNGAATEAEGGRSLLSYLREEARLTGTRKACGEGACGACSVLVDGALLTSCTIPLERIAGRSIVTIEGVPASEMDIYVRAFSEAGAVQCGFCTPGMILAGVALLDENPHPTEAQVRDAIAGNLCRCTGYVKIVDAIEAAARGDA